MLINKPMFDIKSPELEIGSAIWVECTEVMWNSRKKDISYEKMKQTPAILIEVTPLSIRLLWFDPSNSDDRRLTIAIEDVTSGKYTLTPMTHKPIEIQGDNKSKLSLDERDPFSRSTHGI